MRKGAVKNMEKHGSYFNQDPHGFGSGSETPLLLFFHHTKNKCNYMLSDRLNPTETVQIVLREQ